MKVEPIRDKRDIKRIEDMLFAMDTPRGDRMFVMFEVGIYMGMRIGDMLELKVGDIRGKESFYFTPQKTDTRKGKKNYRAKKMTLTIPPELRNVVNHMYKGHGDDEWLFPSRKRDCHTGKLKHITRKCAYDDMKLIGRMSGLNYSIGCHTLRKTFGYHIYRQNHDVAWLQSWYGHSEAAITLIYIGIADDEKKAVTDRMPYDDRSRFDWNRKHAG